jgi:hypothetical protein
MSMRLVPALLVAAGAACAPALASHQESASPLRHLTRDQRLDAIRRAEVWAPTSVASMDLRAGPQGDGSYPPFAAVRCDYVDEKPSGSSAKFNCAVAPGDVVKVKYGKDNVEVYAEVAATRLLWALGFGSDRWYPATVVCRGCPSDPHRDRSQRLGEVTFDVAAIERKMPGKTMETKPDEGWNWSEFDLVGEASGAEQRTHRDALKLLAVFLQHTDSKPVQQRLICPPHESEAGDGAESCREPFMLIHDVGLTFGRANLRNQNQASGANFDRWAAIPIWKDPKRCVGKLSGSFTGTLSDPVISESGRKFLSGLLAQLSDDQLRDLFEIARFSLHSNVPTGQWVDLFKKKRQEIAEVSCPQS